MAETDFNEFARKTLERADRLIRAVGIKTFSAVIQNTPVGNPDLWKVNEGKRRPKPPAGYVGGRLRGNWRCSLGMPDTSSDDSTDKNRGLLAVNTVCPTADRSKTLWLSNSLPYAYRIEYEAHSRQAPAGMVRRNVTRIQRIISSELRNLKD
jgi:hypothetical protein